ncbi:MAG: hypothetical protein H6760_02485 [Candidatus Nomurabacteria bacterium]|nr:MAG: hypothetical protein H6760_02485 [Candidatus Nomurabacteria bacterium]
MNAPTPQFGNGFFSKPNYPRKGVHFFRLLFALKSIDEDKRRKEFILLIILTTSILIVLALNLSVLIRLLQSPDFTDLRVAVPFIILLAFVFLFWLMKKQHITITSYIVVGVYFFSISFAAYTWGIDLPAALLSFGVLLFISGMLISARFGIGLAIATAAILIYFAYLEEHGIHTPDRAWIQQGIRVSDAINFSIILLFLTVISWLANSQINKSLQRARYSEEALKQEKDLLEITVQNRTKALRKIELQKISELSQFAEFGRLAAGLFHDLINPLNGLLLNIHRL